MISFKNVCFTYTKGSDYLLKNISFDICHGEYISIVGNNGSGKSTILKIILGFLKSDRGSLSLKYNRIGFVPQKLDNLNFQFPITVYELLNNHRKILKIKDKTVVLKILQRFNMQDYKDHLVGNLSGGQMQKIFIARALLGKPDLIILDEPSTGIDAISQISIFNMIKDINQEEKITILSVEHNINIALKYSDKILYVDNGSADLLSCEDFISFKGGYKIAAI